MRRMSPSPRNAIFLFAAAALCVSSFGCHGNDALGLEDWQRDLLGSLGGGLAGAVLSDTVIGGGSARDEPGPVGPEGPQGPPGPPIFSIFIDTFFGADLADDLSVVPVSNEEPMLGPGGTPLAYTAVIPSNFVSSNPITMRVLLYRSGPCTGDCFIFTVDARLFRLEADDAQCLGGEAADCSDATRWVRVASPCAQAEDGTEVEQFIVVDLPLTQDALGYEGISPGDVLAFELDTFADDGGIYNVFGVELSDAFVDPVASDEILFTNDDALEACSQ